MTQTERLAAYEVLQTDTNFGVVAIALAQLYARVFAGEPWNEKSKCPSCGRFSKESSGVLCPNCSAGIQLVEAYPLLQTADYIKQEVAKPGSVLETLILTDKRPEFSPAGFAWGYKETIEEFAASKYSPAMAEKVIRLLTGLDGYTTLQDRNEIFYFSECGVDIPYRGNGEANRLFELLRFKAQDYTDNPRDIVMRTRWDSPMVAVAWKNRMQQVYGPLLARMPDRTFQQVGRVVNMLDEDNPDRVLFVLRRQPSVMGKGVLGCGH